MRMQVLAEALGCGGGGNMLLLHVLLMTEKEFEADSPFQPDVAFKLTIVSISSFYLYLRLIVPANIVMFHASVHQVVLSAS